MPSGKTLKLVLYELLQFAALIVPVFVIMERFALLIRDVRGQDVTAYWLVVSASIAYVTSVTLLAWLPLKYVILKQRRFITEITQWRPTALAYLILCTFPCFAIVIASSKIQVDCGKRYNDFSELPASLVLFSLVCVDIVERIRHCRLMGKSDNLDLDLDMSGLVLTNLQQVTTVSGQQHADEGLTQNQPETRNGITSGRQQDFTDTPSRSPISIRLPSAAYLYSSSSHRTYSGPLHVLWKKDGRSEVFVEGFMFWLDTVEMVRVAGEPSVFYSAWVFPVYVLAFLSCLQMIITPHSSLLSLAGVALQDLPFFIIRVGLIAEFGFVTPIFYPLKNVLVTLTYIYFTWLTKLRIFKRQSMF
ncbi:transmembrane protein 236 [Nothobranchius furzeri]|uniref:Transmembrane protein 236 n=2 Tax=Nothobranchius furzeri TaxID=105023 RepID=A0A8C6LE49_NOTFU|nr:transmembrane protein 236 [Nothobranchius furzeri]KAF7222239.1 transmembrane protein 236-like [Nothobranchius furzeri]